MRGVRVQKTHASRLVEDEITGSGNHFVEWGVLDGPRGLGELGPGRYLALLSHSGSRGAGGEVARHYSALARAMRPGLPKGLAHLAWLGLDCSESAFWYNSK